MSLISWFVTDFSSVVLLRQEIRATALLDWLAGPLRTYREIQQRVHLWCRAVPGSLKQFSAMLPSVSSRSSSIPASKMVSACVYLLT